MKKYIKRFMLIIITFFIVFYLNNLVYATTGEEHVSPATPGAGTVCGTGMNCYSLGTAGMRIAVVSPSGELKGETIDLWFYGDHVDLVKAPSTVFVYYDKTGKGEKNLRQDYKGVKDAELNKYVKISTSKEFVLTPIENILPDILAGGEYVSGECVANCNGNVNYNDKYVPISNGYTGGKEWYNYAEFSLNTRVGNFAYTMAKRITENINGETHYGGKTQERYQYINALLEKMKVDDFEQTDYLQIEPLTSWTNDRLNQSVGKNPYSNYAFYGTMTEYYLLASAISRGVPEGSGGANVAIQKSEIKLFCSSSANPENQIIGNKAMSWVWCKSGESTALLDGFSEPPFNTINSRAIYKLTSTGIDYDTSEKNKEIDISFFKKVEPNSTNKFFDVVSNLNQGYAVGFVSLKGVPGNANCNKDAREIITSPGYLSSDYVSKLYGTDDDHSDAIRKECFDDDGKFLNEKCYQLTPDYIKGVGGAIPSENAAGEEIDVCNPVSCEDALYTIDSNGLKYDKNVKTEKPSDTLYGAAIDYIFVNVAQKHLFSDTPEPANDFLNYNVYSSLFVPAACDQKTLVCPITGNGDISCSKDSKDKINKFTIKDTTDSECIEKGYAYSGKSSVKGVVAESAIDLNYKYNDVYCTEEVSFYLPGMPEKEEAGKLLGWGISKDVIDTGYYGKMDVTRTCNYKNFNKGENIDSINITWAKDIDDDTEILLNYHDKKNFVLDKKMDIEFIDFNIVSYNGTLPKEFYSKIYSDDDIDEHPDVYGDELEKRLSDYDCSLDSNKCSNLNQLTSKATYSINYPSSLTWYADKINPFDPTSADEIEEHENPTDVGGNYVYLGTGMLVSFADPNCEFEGTKELYRSEEQLKSAESNNGELSVTIRNIGTRVYPNDSLRHHFDNVLYLDITDDNGISDNMYDKGDKIEGRTGIYYNCPFEISNQLFGTEYGSNSNCEPPTESGSPEGLDVVFRTVNLMEDSSPESLYRAFPGRTGESRFMGYNWLKLGYGSDFNIGAFYGILRSDIYDEKEPMYHIELTPSKIKAIREDNKDKKDAGINPYSKMDNDTYLFYNNVYDSVLLKLYDVDKNKRITVSDATFILTCNNDSSWHEVCPNVIVGKEKAKTVLDYYVESSVVDNMSISDETSIHVSSLYLDTLKESYGLTGVCMDTDAATRITKYRNNGCHYSDKGEVFVYKEGPTRTINLIEAYVRAHESKEEISFKEAFEKVVGSNYTTEVKYKGDSSTTVYTYTGTDGETYTITSDVPDISITEGGFYNQHPADDDGDIIFTADFTG